MHLLDEICNGAIFGAFIFVDNVGVVDALNGHIRRDNNDGQLVNLEEFIFLRLGGTGHAREFVIHTEIILESYRRQSL